VAPAITCLHPAAVAVLDDQSGVMLLSIGSRCDHHGVEFSSTPAARRAPLPLASRAPGLTMAGSTWRSFIDGAAGFLSDNQAHRPTAENQFLLTGPAKIRPAPIHRQSCFVLA